MTTLLKKQPKNLLIKNICNQSLDHLTSFSVAGTPVHDQPVPVHSSLTTLSTASHTHTLPNTPMPGLITCAGHQQQTAGYGHVPHTASHAAHHGAGGAMGAGCGGGSDLSTLTRLSLYLSNHLSSDAPSVRTTSEEDGLILA